MRKLRTIWKEANKSALVGFLILAGGIGYAVHDNSSKFDEAINQIASSGTDVARASCERQNNITEGVRYILKRSFDVRAQQGDLNPEAEAFLRDALAHLQVLDCSKVSVSK